VLSRNNKFFKTSADPASWPHFRWNSEWSPTATSDCSPLVIVIQPSPRENLGMFSSKIKSFRKLIQHDSEWSRIIYHPTLSNSIYIIIQHSNKIIPFGMFPNTKKHHLISFARFGRPNLHIHMCQTCLYSRNDFLILDAGSRILHPQLSNQYISNINHPVNHQFRIPSGKRTVCYWKWPIYSWYLLIKNGDFP